ncbi:MAG: hypothetical protein WBG46_05100 [Nonlabens sp.]
MKLYKLENDQLILEDASPFKLSMIYIASWLSIIYISLMMFKQNTFEWNSVTILISIILAAAIFLSIWVFFRKTFKAKFPVKSISKLKQSRFNGSVYYLELKNKRQRNLSKITTVQEAIDLLEFIRTENDQVEANFTERDSHRISA